jgi:hypothetical protein
VVADCSSGENPTFEAALWATGVPFVVGLKPSKRIWAPVDDPHMPEEAAHCLRWGGMDDPRDSVPIKRRFRDGHTEIWWATDMVFGGYGPDQPVRLVVAMTDPRRCRR